MNIDLSQLSLQERKGEEKEKKKEKEKRVKHPASAIDSGSSFFLPAKICKGKKRRGEKRERKRRKVVL